jgi:hypothetical protein
MTEKKQAQRVTDALDATPTLIVSELRRLERINVQLLEALELLVGNEDARNWGVFGVDSRSAFTKARAAIKAAKGEA